MNPVGIEILSKLYPLDTMQRAHLELLTEECQAADLRRGDIVFRQGENDGKTVFLISGKLLGKYEDGREREVDGNSPNTRYAVGDLQPRRFTATVSSAAARIVTFNRGFLEKVLTWDQISRSPQFQLHSTADSARWVFRMLRSRALLRLPAGNVQRMFERFDSVEVQPNAEVIREGDEGDYFYVIKAGEFEVVKKDRNVQKIVAVLHQGDSFGEDALISNQRRNATIKARRAGSLMRLSRQDFSELLRHPVVDWITPGQASALINLGAQLLDVRMEEEYSQTRLVHSTNTPLFRLREDVTGKEKTNPYVVYCETGERSASAAFILNKLGFQAYAIRGGLSSVRQLMVMTGAS